jgi:hypothetical protein
MGLAWTPPVSIEFVETLSYHRMGMLAYPSFKMAKVQIRRPHHNCYAVPERWGHNCLQKRQT